MPPSYHCGYNHSADASGSRYSATHFKPWCGDPSEAFGRYCPNDQVTRKRRGQVQKDERRCRRPFGSKLHRANYPGDHVTAAGPRDPDCGLTYLTGKALLTCHENSRIDPKRITRNNVTARNHLPDTVFPASADANISGT